MNQPKDDNTSDLVQSHFASLAHKADEVLVRFYDLLFTNHPEVKPLFANTDMDQQRGHLKAALILAMDNLKNPDALEPVLRDMGRRHVDYGVQPEHYAMVGESLITALREASGNDWNPELEQGWSAVLQQVATTMIAGTEQEG